MEKLVIPSIKSPLRYPGGKSKALKQILPLIPSFKEMREPMVGGASVSIALKQVYPNSFFWINDLNKDLYYFWKSCQENVQRLIDEIITMKKNTANGQALYQSLIESYNNFTAIQKGARFFILNRITFSGLAESGGYSEQAFKTRFTESSIQRLIKAAKILQETKITNYDYKKVVSSEGEDVFIFLDPPYFTTTKSKLYGKKGDLHERFDHKRFANVMKQCPHKWLITYDDCKEVRDLFSFANIKKWTLQYGMNNYKQKTAGKGKELFISNYNLPVSEKTQKKILDF